MLPGLVGSLLIDGYHADIPLFKTGNTMDWNACVYSDEPENYDAPKLD